MTKSSEVCYIHLTPDFHPKRFCHNSVNYTMAVLIGALFGVLSVVCGPGRRIQLLSSTKITSHEVCWLIAVLIISVAWPLWPHLVYRLTQSTHISLHFIRQLRTTLNCNIWDDRLKWSLITENSRKLFKASVPLC